MLPLLSSIGHFAAVAQICKWAFFLNCMTVLQQNQSSASMRMSNSVWIARLGYLFSRLYLVGLVGQWGTFRAATIFCFNRTDLFWYLSDNGLRDIIYQWVRVDQRPNAICMHLRKTAVYIAFNNHFYSKPPRRNELLKGNLTKTLDCVELSRATGQEGTESLMQIKLTAIMDFANLASAFQLWSSIHHLSENGPFL